MKKTVSTKVAPVVEVEESEAVDYNNYSQAELREACTNFEIKFSALDSKKVLIEKLKANESRTN